MISVAVILRFIRKTVTDVVLTLTLPLAGTRPACAPQDASRSNSLPVKAGWRLLSLAVLMATSVTAQTARPDLMAGMNTFALATPPCIPETVRVKPRSDGSFPGYFSPTTAFALSFFGTALPLAGILMTNHDVLDSEDALAYFGAGAIIIGPSLGYLASSNAGRGMLGVGIRTVSVAVLAAILSGADNGTSDLGWTLLFASVSYATLAGSALVDIFDAPNYIRGQNVIREYEYLSISPEFSCDGKRYGLRLVIHF